jgi:hypothetical protein
MHGLSHFFPFSAWTALAAVGKYHPLRLLVPYYRSLDGARPARDRVWTFTDWDDTGMSIDNPDWSSIQLNDCFVYIVFDSDVMVNPKVYVARKATSHTLAATARNIWQRSRKPESIVFPREGPYAPVGGGRSPPL